MIPKPLIPVSDAVGVVVAVGAGITHIKEGDRVNSHLFPPGSMVTQNRVNPTSVTALPYREVLRST